MGVVDRRRHELRRFPAGIAEHDPLIARSLVPVAGGIDSLRDVGGLRMEQNFDVGGSPVETLLLVTDVLDRAARRGLDRVLFDRRAAHLARDDDPVGRRQGLARNPGLIGIQTGFRAFAEEKVDNLVGNPVAHLVRMAFRDGFTCKQVIFASQWLISNGKEQFVATTLLASCSFCQAIRTSVFV